MLYPGPAPPSPSLSLSLSHPSLFGSHLPRTELEFYLLSRLSLSPTRHPTRMRESAFIAA
jgi:hypothetical protein